MTKLRNRYPNKDIACVLCFLRVFQTTQEYLLGRSEDCLCCQFLEWKLQVDLTVKQVHSEWTYFNCYTVLLVDWKSLSWKSLRAKPSSDFSRTVAGNRAYFHWGLFSYVGEFNKRGIGEIQ